jgi:hypothetical protein
MLRNALDLDYALDHISLDRGFDSARISAVVKADVTDVADFFDLLTDQAVKGKKQSSPMPLSTSTPETRCAYGRPNIGSPVQIVFAASADAVVTARTSATRCIPSTQCLRLLPSSRVMHFLFVCRPPLLELAEQLIALIRC